MDENALDFSYNISALAIAILRNDVFIPEQAFAILYGGKYRLTDDDTRDMIALKEAGLSYKAIGDIYGLYQGAIFYRIKRLNKEGDFNANSRTERKNKIS